MDAQNWFAVDAPKEMSEAFAEISATYPAAQTGQQGEAARREIERRLDLITDSTEWFASCMYLEVVSARRATGVQWAAGR